MTEEHSSEQAKKRSAWAHLFRGLWRSPIGIAGLLMTISSVALMMFGMALVLAGAIENPYFNLFIYTALPGALFTGIGVMFFSAYIRRRQWHKYGIEKGHLQINLSDHKHRKAIMLIVFLSTAVGLVMALLSYEAYHFTDSTGFCGTVCHKVMTPEYTVYKRSPHARVGCVECHIGPGAQWFVRAKLSGLRQVKAVMTDSYSRPIPSPVEHLRPAMDTCGNCHWTEKFSGKKVKTFISFTNEEQLKPSYVDIALHVGGKNLYTSAFEGIHWHVSKDVKVQYKALNPRRTGISSVKVTRPDGSTAIYKAEGKAEGQNEWRTMDCIDCHNRPTHIYDMPIARIDFGLASGKIDGAVKGIREDSITVLTAQYTTRNEAEAQMPKKLLELQTKRNGQEAAAKDAGKMKSASDYLVKTYMDNIWPEMNIKWGTYGNHIGHQRADEGYGCFRCHNYEMKDDKGRGISQDCTLCHDMPNYR